VPALLGFGPPPPPEPAELARDAFTRSQSASTRADAVRWLDRACRLVPGDLTLKLALAAGCMGLDDARAASLFADVVAERPVCEAWLGLAGSLRVLGDLAGAARALASALSAYALVPSLEKLATVIAGEVGAAGWCGYVASDQVVIRLADQNATARLCLDGQEVGPPVPSGVHRLPRRGGPWHSVAVLPGNDLHLLGSAIRLAEIRRTEGFVEPCEGGLAGWVWHPGEPDTDPVLTVRAEKGRKFVRLVATDPACPAALDGLARVRAFRLAAAALTGMGGLLRVTGSDGLDLLGSPIDPSWERQVAIAGARAIARGEGALPPVLAGTKGPLPPTPSRKGRGGHVCPVDVVVTVHGAARETLACLESVRATLRPPSRLVVVDDASPDPELAAALDRMARKRWIRLIRHTKPRGFPASANAGLLACRGRDVVLLNSDTVVVSGWLAGLRAAAYSKPDVGTATPFSNSATILSYPAPAGTNPFPDARETTRLAAHVHRANAGTVVEIPVAVGFCMYIRWDCLDSVGLFRTGLFGQGYGEENDFCLRARHLGWRHVAAPSVFVAHAGGRSFGPARQALQVRNQAILNQLYPGYDRLIADWVAADTLAGARRRVDLLRWRAARRRKSTAVVLITHADGGGVEVCVAASCRTHRAAGRRAIVLRPDRTEGTAPGVVVGDGTEGGFPNLRYSLPSELPALRRLLLAEAAVGIELHHVLGHAPAIYELITSLGIPYEVHAHDYVWFCPRVLLIGADRRYCGEPDVATCETCVADAGSALEESISVAALRERSARLLAGAWRVVVPSYDVATRLCRHFPGVRPVVVPHEDDSTLPTAAQPPPPGSGRRRVCVVGAIGVAKGYDILLACARDAASRDLPLEFTVVGHTIDDRRLMATGRVFVTGEFRAEEVTSLIRAQHADLAFAPSIWPETWCFALTDAWRAGLRAAAFDIGAPAERIRRSGRGFLLPLGLSASAINNALLAAALLKASE
jgi:GT2 family glycosyltransferase/glycosyltransferase involved in cell wall biosynthesis